MGREGKFRLSFDGAFLTGSEAGSRLERLERLGEDPNIELIYPKPGRVKELEPEAIRDCHGFLAIFSGITERTLTGANRLKLVSRFGAGFDTVDLDACTRRGIWVTNVPEGPPESLAQGALTLMLALNMNLFKKESILRNKGWGEAGNHHGRDLLNKTLGVIGLGNIGTRFVEMVAPFRMRVIAYDPYAPIERFRKYGVEPVSLEKLVRGSDYISIHCPLTDESRHMLKEEHFRAMKPTAYLINTSRGNFYPDALLARALKGGWLAGAGTDVFEVEPISDDNPLLDAENCVLTPHHVGITHELMDRYWASVTRSITQAARGEIPDHIINPEVLAPEQLKAAKLSTSFVPGRAKRRAES